MWIHWNKATNLFHAEEVSRILSFPAPRLNDLVRIDMKDYALCYQFPSSPTGFQNFSMWPLFNCLSIPNIVGVIEAAVSPTRRIIFDQSLPGHAHCRRRDHPLLRSRLRVEWSLRSRCARPPCQGACSGARPIHSGYHRRVPYSLHRSQRCPCCRSGPQLRPDFSPPTS